MHGDSRKFFPLNYSAGDPNHIELPWGSIRLAVARDGDTDNYLLYPHVATFLTPSWSPSQPSLEEFYVWWFDAKHETLQRQLLPRGPWITDAKLDMVLGRAARNFSCGTDCYRHYDVAINSGNVMVTNSGRRSAVSESVMGTYRLRKNSTKWEKVADGKPESEDST